jgi:hypothetical protein
MTETRRSTRVHSGLEGPDSLELARQARQNSRASFLAAVDSGVEMRKVTESIAEHVRLNHFGDGLEKAMRLRKADGR